MVKALLVVEVCGASVGSYEARLFCSLPSHIVAFCAIEANSRADRGREKGIPSGFFVALLGFPVLLKRSPSRVVLGAGRRFSAEQVPQAVLPGCFQEPKVSFAEWMANGGECGGRRQAHGKRRGGVRALAGFLESSALGAGCCSGCVACGAACRGERGLGAAGRHELRRGRPGQG